VPVTTVASIPFGTRRIGPGLPVVVIAEIGVNHEGDAELCLRMVEAAARSGADAVKLQTVKADECYVPGTESHAIFSRAELAEADTARVFALARELGTEPFTTCGDLASVDFVQTLGPAAWKISSGLLTHLPLIRRLAATGQTLLLSTGMAGLASVDRAVAVAREAGAEHLGVFQCTSIYPAPPESLNLRAIRTLERRYGIPAGLSDHSEGVEAAPLAVAAGACMIEKHFSLDPSRPGFDHRLSLDPAGFARMVAAVRRAEGMLGSGDKVLAGAEQENAARFHRCLVARRDVVAGATLAAEDLAVMRVAPEAGRGLPPEALDQVPGRRAARDIRRFEPIFAKDLL